MLSLFTVFGFTTLESTLWNLVAYAAFISIIVGVLYERFGTMLITIGAAVLALYSAFFLKDAVFAVLQTIITVSGVMRLRRIENTVTAVTIAGLAILALPALVLYGTLQGAAAIAGAGGLLCIAFGIVLLPRSGAYLLMTVGGILLIAYAWNAGAWVFFWLNIFFALANIKEYFAART